MSEKEHEATLPFHTISRQLMPLRLCKENTREEIGVVYIAAEDISTILEVKTADETMTVVERFSSDTPLYVTDSAKAVELARTHYLELEQKRRDEETQKAIRDFMADE